MSENENKYDISKHPLVVISLAVVGTFGFSYQFVLPIMTAKLQNDAEKVPGYEKKIDELEKKLGITNTQLQAAQNSNLLTRDSPYPVGLGKVRIGDSVNSLTSLYENINKGDDYWQVKNAHSFFIVVTYFFDETSPNKKITHILFRSNWNIGKENLLQEIFENKYGMPRKFKNNQYLWYVANERIHKFEDFSYVLYPSK